MTDASRRELERDPLDDEAAGRLLMARVRDGELELEQIELLAYVGHPPAWAALGWEPVGFSANASESMHAKLFRRTGQEILYEIAQRPEPWVTGLQRWGRDAVLRAVVAGAHHCFPVWEKRFREEFGEVEAALGDGRAFSPGVVSGLIRTFEAAALLGAEDFWARTVEAGFSLGNRWDAPPFSYASASELRPRFALHLEVVARYCSAGGNAGYLPWAVGSFEESARFVLMNPPEGYRNFSKPVGWDARVRRAETPLRERVRHELAAWILGEEADDPVRQRVAEIAAIGQQATDAS